MRKFDVITGESHDDWTEQDNGHLTNGDYTIAEINGEYLLTVEDFNAYDYYRDIGLFKTEALAMEAAEDE